MKDLILDDFQNYVDESLIRHRSILDVITKYSESTAKVNRSIIKAVTNCGCIEINSSEKYCRNDSDKTLDNFLNSHLNGHICEDCREVIEKELGSNIFYLVALCNHLDINLYDVFIKEYNRTMTLGKFNLR